MSHLRPDEHRGSMSVLVLGAVMGTTVFLLVALLPLFESQRVLSSTKRQIHTEAILRERADLLLDMFSEDPTPDADSRWDPVWDHILLDGGVRLEDLSSRLGLLWIRREPMETVDPFVSGLSFTEFQTLRTSSPLIEEISPLYDHLFKPSRIDLFTGYGYFDVHVSDELMLQRVVLERTGDKELAFSFRTWCAKRRMEREQERLVPISPQELRAALGVAYEDLFPLISVAPPLNVNFVDEQIMRLLASHYGIPSHVVETIARWRDRGEISSEMLDELLEPYRTTFFPFYFGTKTWIWKLTLKEEDVTLVRLIARIPEEAETTPPRWRLVGEWIE